MDRRRERRYDERDVPYGGAPYRGDERPPRSPSHGGPPRRDRSPGPYYSNGYPPRGENGFPAPRADIRDSAPMRGGDAPPRRRSRSPSSRDRPVPSAYGRPRSPSGYRRDRSPGPRPRSPFGGYRPRSPPRQPRYPDEREEYPPRRNYGPPREERPRFPRENNYRPHERSPSPPRRSAYASTASSRRSSPPATYARPDRPTPPFPSGRPEYTERAASYQRSYERQPQSAYSQTPYDQGTGRLEDLVQRNGIYQDYDRREPPVESNIRPYNARPSASDGFPPREPASYPRSPRQSPPIAREGRDQYGVRDARDPHDPGLDFARPGPAHSSRSPPTGPRALSERDRDRHGYDGPASRGYDNRPPLSGSNSYTGAPFRSSNSTSTTYPRTQRFNNGTVAPGSASASGSALGTGSAGIVAAHLASLPVLIEGGKKLPSVLDPERERRLAQLEEEKRKLEDLIAEKQRIKRQGLREWEKAEREAKRESLKSELAESHLEKLGGEVGGTGGAY